MPAHRSGKNGTRKYGRNKIKCASYKSRRQREKNKVKKLSKLLKYHFNDKKLLKAIEKFKNFIKS